MKQAIKQALEILDGGYSINVQITHPEAVSEEVLAQIEESAEEALIDLTNSENRRETLRLFFLERFGADEEEISGAELLTTYADWNCDHFHTQTTTPVVEPFELQLI